VTSRSNTIGQLEMAIPVSARAALVRRCLSRCLGCRTRVKALKFNSQWIGRMKIDVQEFIDQADLSILSYIVLGTTMLVMFIDGFDVFVVGRIAPAIAHGLGEPSSKMSEVFLLQQTGLAAGAFALSPLSDRYGRRIVLALCLAVFGLLSLVCVFATSIRELAVLRGLASVFLSGAMPTVLALLVEMTPQRWRSTFLSIALSAYAAGAALSAGVAAWLLTDYGWQIAFWIGGLAPLLCMGLVAALPESLMFRLGRNTQDPKITRTLMRFSPGETFDGSLQFFGVAPRRVDRKQAIFEVVSEGRGLSSLLVWLCCLIHMGTTALLASWMSTFFLEMGGVPIEQFSVSLTISFIGGLVGTFFAGYLMDRFGWARVLQLYFFALTLAIAGLGLVPFSARAFILILIAWNFLQSGGQSGLTALLTKLYPVNVRSTGVGWGLGVGRLGGIVAPLFGGIALASKFSLPTTFGLISTMPALILFLLWVLPAVRAQALPAVRAQDVQ
jgi:AAHS family 4-hydroxybenzoate transporter-like MFS transporter